jgi:uncharacterized protein (TIRG00374 family)
MTVDHTIVPEPPPTDPAPMPEELNPRHLRARLIQLALLVAAIVAVVVAAPGLGSLRDRLRDASPGWLALAVVLELLSALSYVVIFRAVFCPRMSWRLSYEIGMAEQAANSLLPAGGAGGLALGAWALRRGGASVDHIARRTVAFFLLTSLANVGTLVVFAIAFAAGALGNDSAPWVTYAFGGAGLVGIVLVLALPSIAARRRGAVTAVPGGQEPPEAVARAAHRVRDFIRRGMATVVDGVNDSVTLLRRRPVGVLVGSFGYMGFDIAVLAACYAALGPSPSFGVLVVAYIVGQLGGLLPIPGGIGGTEGGLIGTFLLFHAPLATTTVAVLAYRAIQLWLPAVLGSIAFVQLRSTLRAESRPAMLCSPLAVVPESVEPLAAESGS